MSLQVFQALMRWGAINNLLSLPSSKKTLTLKFLFWQIFASIAYATSHHYQSYWNYMTGWLDTLYDYVCVYNSSTLLVITSVYVTIAQWRQLNKLSRKYYPQSENYNLLHCWLRIQSKCAIILRHHFCCSLSVQISSNYNNKSQQNEQELNEKKITSECCEQQWAWCKERNMPDRKQ